MQARCTVAASRCKVLEPDEASSYVICRYVLRNWIAQNAIQKAESGDYSEVQRVLKLLEQPFSDDAASLLNHSAQAAAGQVCERPLQYDGPVPQWAKRLCVSCSS